MTINKDYSASIMKRLIMNQICSDMLDHLENTPEPLEYHQDIKRALLTEIDDNLRMNNEDLDTIIEEIKLS